MPVPASQAMGVIREFGRGRPDPPIPRMPTETVHIISVFPRTAFSKVLSFGQYEMPACPPCEAHDKAPCDRCDNYASLEVASARDPIDDPNVVDGSGRRFTVISAADVAASLVVEGCLDRGVFVTTDETPTKGELAEARQNYRTWAERMLKEADGIWAQKRDAAWINPLANDAAGYLGATRDWKADTSKRTSCLACGEQGSAGIAICSKCGFPVDWQKAFAMDLPTDKQKTYGKKAGLFVDPDAAEAEEDESAETAVSGIRGAVVQDKKTGKFKKAQPEVEL